MDPGMKPPEESPAPPAYRVETWGCQMNVLDGQRMAGQLETAGMRRAAEGEEAGVILLNTCMVREKAESKVYSALGVIARRKQQNPELVVGVTGCVAQVSGEEILERAPWVDFVAGTGHVEKIGALVEEARRERRRALTLELPEEDPVYQFREIARDSPYQAYVTVIEGCDQFCTFCVVPFTRGRERCRKSSEIVEELTHLAGSGFTEVTLLGQTVNAYRDPETGTGLGQLLRRAARVPGLRRVRFLTSHPRLVDDDLVAALGEGVPIAPYFHLPAQSGSDRVLGRMKRRYTSAEYLRTIERIRKAVPQIAISSDFIVGFPGESEGEFEQTLALVREVRFSNVFGFRYSRRAGTAAARWASDAEIPEEVSAERLARLLDLQTVLQRQTNEALIGREFELLIEGEEKGKSRGRTPCNRIVHVEDGPGRVAPGEYTRVRIERGLPNSLIARLAEETGVSREAQ
jgi:tRNA-2-methylthio-N6-dimethylallyladenosine synthase